jgi:hypothetical protein
VVDAGQRIDDQDCGHAPSPRPSRAAAAFLALGRNVRDGTRGAGIVAPPYLPLLPCLPSSLPFLPFLPRLLPPFAPFYPLPRMKMGDLRIYGFLGGLRRSRGRVRRATPNQVTSGYLQTQVTAHDRTPHTRDPRRPTGPSARARRRATHTDEHEIRLPVTAVVTQNRSEFGAPRRHASFRTPSPRAPPRQRAAAATSTPVATSRRASFSRPPSHRPARAEC